jgi:hypothetical protein
MIFSENRRPLFGRCWRKHRTVGSWLVLVIGRPIVREVRDWIVAQLRSGVGAIEQLLSAPATARGGVLNFILSSWNSLPPQSHLRILLNFQPQGSLVRIRHSRKSAKSDRQHRHGPSDFFLTVRDRGDWSRVVRSIPARASLYARPGTKMAREAAPACRVPWRFLHTIHAAAVGLIGVRNVVCRAANA